MGGDVISGRRRGRNGNPLRRQTVNVAQLGRDAGEAVLHPREAITISDMLSHRSGIHSFTDDPKYPLYMTKEQSREQMLARIAGYEPDFNPDEQFAYSNSNYALLGYIIEGITQSTYQQELAKRIAAETGLANTSCGDQIDTKENEAASYTVLDGRWAAQFVTDMSVPGGAGAIVSTPLDLTAFITALFDHELINEQSLDQMLEMKDGYGKGIFPTPVEENVGDGHNGQIDAFWSMLAYFPDQKVAATLLANGVDGNFDDILTGIGRIYFNLPFEIPDFTPLPTPTVAGTVAFSNVVAAGANADIYVVNTDGTGLRPLAETLGWEEDPSWSPDGSRIVYAAYPRETVFGKPPACGS